MNKLKGYLSTRDEVSRLLYHFYGKIEREERLAPLFSQVLGEHKVRHMDKLTDFWEMQLFGKGNYSGNPMQIHQDLHQRSTLTEAHFDLWLTLFKESVEELFEGEYAERAIQRSISIATVMKMKILYGQ